LIGFVSPIFMRAPELRRPVNLYSAAARSREMRAFQDT